MTPEGGMGACPVLPIYPRILWDDVGWIPLGSLTRAHKRNDSRVWFSRVKPVSGGVGHISPVRVLLHPGYRAQRLP